MRGCLSVLFIAVGLVLVVAWLGGPALAGVAVERSLDAAGFVAADRSVTVAADPALEILAGHADRITIRASGATVRNLTAARLAITLSDVDLVAGRYSRIDGQLEDVLIRSADGSSAHASSMTLRGPADATTTTVRIDKAVVEALLSEAIRRQTGLSLSGVTLSEPDRIRFTAGLTISGRFAVASDGSLVIAATSGNSRFTVFQPDPQLRLDSAAVVAGQLVLTGTSDLRNLIR